MLNSLISLCGYSDKIGMVQIGCRCGVCGVDLPFSAATQAWLTVFNYPLQGGRPTTNAMMSSLCKNTGCDCHIWMWWLGCVRTCTCKCLFEPKFLTGPAECTTLPVYTILAYYVTSRLSLIDIDIAYYDIAYYGRVFKALWGYIMVVSINQMWLK